MASRWAQEKCGCAHCHGGAREKINCWADKLDEAYHAGLEQAMKQDPDAVPMNIHAKVQMLEDRIENLLELLRHHERNWGRIHEHLHSWLPDKCFAGVDVDHNSQQVIAAFEQIRKTTGVVSDCVGSLSGSSIGKSIVGGSMSGDEPNCPYDDDPGRAGYSPATPVVPNSPVADASDDRRDTLATGSNHDCQHKVCSSCAEIRKERDQWLAEYRAVRQQRDVARRRLEQAESLLARWVTVYLDDPAARDTHKFLEEAQAVAIHVEESE